MCQAVPVARWGEETSFGTLEAFDGVMISVPPQQASIQSPGGAGAKTGERERCAKSELN